MKFQKTPDHFQTEAQALEEIANRGWHAIASTFHPEKDLHWHDFDVVAFILEGTASAEFDDGSIEEASAGARVEAPAGIVHRNVGASFRAILGVSVDPAKMTQPVNKPVVAGAK